MGYENEPKVYDLQDLETKKRANARNVFSHANQRVFHDEKPENKDLEINFGRDISEPEEKRYETSTSVKIEPKSEENLIRSLHRVKSEKDSECPYSQLIDNEAVQQAGPSQKEVLRTPVRSYKVPIPENKYRVEKSD